MKCLDINSDLTALYLQVPSDAQPVDLSDGLVSIETTDGCTYSRSKRLGLDNFTPIINTRRAVSSRELIARGGGTGENPYLHSPIRGIIVNF